MPVCATCDWESGESSQFVHGAFGDLANWQRKDFFEKWINERELMIRSLSSKNGPNSEKKVLPVSVGEIEVEIKSTIERRKNLINSDGMHHQDKYFIEKAITSF